MTKKKRLLLAGLLLFVIIIFPPIFAPILHDNDSPRSALRKDIFKDGHPYQSFLALITKGDYEDRDYGQRYNVFWFNFDSPTGATATICYTRKAENENYEVSCGTGP
ncbi:hypothetical protein [Pradoshia sp.]